MAQRQLGIGVELAAHGGPLAAEGDVAAPARTLGIRVRAVEHQRRQVDLVPVFGRTFRDALQDVTLDLEESGWQSLYLDQPCGVDARPILQPHRH